MDAGSSSPPRPLRIVMLPWVAFGHMLPSLELAQRLASRGHYVSFVSTPGNIARFPPLRPAAAPHLDLVALPLPRIDGLPDGAESSNNVPLEKSELLIRAFDGLAAPFAEFLAAACADERRRPDWIIAEAFSYWAVAAALEHKVRSVRITGGAAALIENRAIRPRYELELERSAQLNFGDGMPMAQRFRFIHERCTFVVLRSCLEWEPEFFPQVAPSVRKPLVPLGLMPPSLDEGRADGDDASVRWLDAQLPGSVLYVALGSEVPLSVAQVHELALGLELSGTRFLWALRKPYGVSDADILPPGFQERTQLSGQGLITMGWVPQISILGHGAVGAFLTHCGQSSLIEGLFFGLPLVMLPMLYDQGPNARFLEGKKVGVQVARDENDGSFDRHGVTSAVRAVMLEEDTRAVFVENALKMQRISADKELHESYIDEFVQQLRSYTVNNGVDLTNVTPSSAV